MVVGKGAVTTTWHLPKELLVNASPFFAAALNGSFSEAKSRRITLPEDSPYGFALFVRWLYVGRISGDIFGREGEAFKSDVLGTPGNTSDDDADLPVAQMHLQACILGDKLGCLSFRDLAVLELIEYHSQRAIREEEIRYVFDHSAQGSKLRQYMIDQLRWDLQEGHLSDYTCEFLSDARFAEDFGPVFLETSLKADGAAINPERQQERYLEVLTGWDGD